MKRNITKKRRGEKKGKKPSDAQCNCSPPADRCPSSDPPLPANSPPIYLLGMMFCGTEYPFG